MFLKFFKLVYVPVFTGLMQLFFAIIYKTQLSDALSSKNCDECRIEALESSEIFARCHHSCMEIDLNRFRFENSISSYWKKLFHGTGTDYFSGNIISIEDGFVNILSMKHCTHIVSGNGNILVKKESILRNQTLLCIRILQVTTKVVHHLWIALGESHILRA